MTRIVNLLVSGALPLRLAPFLGGSVSPNLELKDVKSNVFDGPLPLPPPPSC